MTFAIAIVLPTTVMVAADRRLMSSHPRLKRQLATKMCRVETTDAHGLITYAGTGAILRRSLPFELSDWIAKVLRGQTLTFVQAMAKIAYAATEQKLTKWAKNHTFMFAGFHNDRPLIHLITAEKHSDEAERHKRRHGIDFVGMNFFGSGAYPIGTGRASVGAGRPLYRLASALSQSEGSTTYRYRAMALLSEVVRDVSKRHQDVSPECVCCWYDRRKTGDARIYDAQGRLIQNGEAVPAVAGGWDVGEVMRHIEPIMTALMEERMRAQTEGQPLSELDEERIHAAMARIKLSPTTEF